MEPYLLTVAFPSRETRRAHVIGLLHATSCAAALDGFRRWVPRHPELEGVRIEPLPLRVEGESALSLSGRSWSPIRRRGAAVGFAYGVSDIVGKVRNWRREYEVEESEVALASRREEEADEAGIFLTFDQALDLVRRERRRPRRRWQRAPRWRAAAPRVEEWI